eukprot:COSAG06_NODE_1522_length_9205_cov_36.374588_7_plen_350_part_00
MGRKKQKAPPEDGQRSWVNPIDQSGSDDESPDPTSWSAIEGMAFDVVTDEVVNPLDSAESVKVGAGGEALEEVGGEALDAYVKRSASVKGGELSPRQQQMRDLAHSKIATFVQNEEFGEATLDDLDVDPELVAHMHEWCGLKHPRTQVSLAYDLIQFVLLMYIVAWVPWRIAFETETTPDEFMYWWDIFVDLALVFDMFLLMNRYYYDDIARKLITDHKTIRNNYLKVRRARCTPWDDSPPLTLLLRMSVFQRAGSSWTSLPWFRLISSSGMPWHTTAATRRLSAARSSFAWRASLGSPRLRGWQSLRACASTPRRSILRFVSSGWAPRGRSSSPVSFSCRSRCTYFHT